jgi:putative endonuclease
MAGNYYIYMVANWTNEVLYVGMTNDLERRIAEHKSKLIPGFTWQYNCTKLVYFEHTSDAGAAIAREKQLKNWRRNKRMR